MTYLPCSYPNIASYTGISTLGTFIYRGIEDKCYKYLSRYLLYIFFSLTLYNEIPFTQLLEPGFCVDKILFLPFFLVSCLY